MEAEDLVQEVSEMKITPKPVDETGDGFNLDDLVLEVACSVARQDLIQSRRRKRRDEGEYAQTNFNHELDEERMKEIDERMAAMLEMGKKQKPKLIRQFLKDQLTSLKFDLPDEVRLD
jgi:hypothetical protein